LNAEIARFTARLPVELLYGAGRGKLILREVAYRYLPCELIDRSKIGFGVLGSDWAGPEIRTVAQTLLGSRRAHYEFVWEVNPWTMSSSAILTLLVSRPWSSSSHGSGPTP